MIQPSLDWWHVSDPYSGQKLPLYLLIRDNETFPLVVNAAHYSKPMFGPDPNGPPLYADACLTQTSSIRWCPGFGFDALQAWAVSNYEGRIAPNLTMIETMTGLQRTLTADSVGRGAAIAATQSNWVVHLYGLFIRFLERNHPGLASLITYPMYTSADPIYAPVVQVQCHTVDANQTNGVDFLTDSLTNFTDSGAVWYDAQMSWPVPDKAWNFSSSTSESLVNLTWVDLSKGQDGQQQATWRPSIGAVVKMLGLVDGRPTSYVIPCIVDARWAASSASYQPTMSDVVISNLSDPAALALKAWGRTSVSANAKTKTRQQLGIGNVIQIDSQWARLLNAPGYSVKSWHNVTGIEAMLYSYIQAIDHANYSAFTPGPRDGRHGDDSADLMLDAADTVATIMSLVIADGLSRLSDAGLNVVVLDAKKDGNLTWAYLDSDFYPANTQEVSQIAPFKSVSLQVQRYGWGYGWSTIIILDVIVLFMHLLMVISYTCYQAFLHIRGHWSTATVWNDVVELIILAWDSAPTEAFREAEEVKSSFWTQNISVRERCGGDGDGAAMELVAGRSNDGSGEGLLRVGKKYL